MENKFKLDITIKENRLEESARRKEESQVAGITLIALVLTIIVILILAGVAIMTLMGENGLINRTISAKEENEASKAKEELQLAIEALKVDYYEKGENGTFKSYILNNEVALADALGNGKNVEVNGQDLEYQNYTFELSDDGTLTKVESKPFDPEEWDKTAADYDCFYWASDDPSSEEYGIVIGYTAKIDSYTKLRFPSRCTQIEFYGLYGPGDAWNKTYSDGTTVGASRSFTNNILQVEIPATVKEIGNSAFGGGSEKNSFSSLKKVAIENGVVRIGDSAFESCASLTNITVPNSVTTIGSFAFNYCTSLNNITIPNSVTSIGGGAFCGCTSLEKIYIPISVAKIEVMFLGGAPGGRPFCYCSDQLQIYTEASEDLPEWDADWNSNGSVDLEVHYNTTLEEYKAL